ncbi:MAG TPA: 50S ribosomal protein L30 [Patescibacteria group bacterium]|nr:50S ribosomal protein L30 [Patescibacteria group bacterium]
MDRKCYLAIRIRGGVNLSDRNEKNLRFLRMDRNMTATFLDDRPDYAGMLQRARDQVTWGEPTIEMIRLILEKRGRIVGDKPIDISTVKAWGFDSFDELATAIHSCQVELDKLMGAKPFFRLHPPRKGFKRTIKKHYGNDGELGYRGEAINELAKRMS